MFLHWANKVRLLSRDWKIPLPVHRDGIYSISPSRRLSWLAENKPPPVTERYCLRIELLPVKIPEIFFSILEYASDETAVTGQDEK